MRDLYKLFCYCCKYESLSIVQNILFIEPRINKMISTKNIKDACTTDNREVILWLYKECKLSLKNCDFIATDNNHFDLLKFIYSQDNSINTCFSIACSKCDFEMIKWCHEKNKEKYDYNAIFYYCCLRGNMEILMWLYETFDINLNKYNSNQCINNACANGHIDLAKWIKNNGNVPDYNCPFGRACERNHLDVAQWLYPYVDKISNDTLYNVCKRGHIDILKWLKTISTLPSDIIEYALCYNRMEIVNWLWTDNTRVYITLDELYIKGHYDAIVWLTEHNYYLEPQCNMCKILCSVLFNSRKNILLLLYDLISLYDYRDEIFFSACGSNNK